MGLSQQPGQQRNKGHTDEGNATSGDKLANPDKKVLRMGIGDS